MTSTPTSASDGPRPHALYSTKASLVLCPGQGAQHAGMGKAWAEKHAAAREVFQDADRILGFSLSTLCFDGPEERLNRTDMAQVAIYVSSVACFRALAETDRITSIAAAAGLSLGEFTALHIAGAYDFETGLKLVRLRGQAMQEAAEAVPSGMVAVIGTDQAQARLICEDSVRDGEVLVPANFTCPGQVVLSGHKTACDRALQRAESMGVKATALKVAGAFHSPLMRPAAEKLKAALDQATWSTPAFPILSNVTGILHEINKADYVKARLVDQLTGPVRWEQGMIWLITHVPGHFIELAPGKVLSGLMKRIDRSVPVSNHAEPV